MLSDEQRRELGFARDMRDMLSIVERIVAEQVEASRAEDQREIATLRGEKAAEEMHAEGKSCPVCTHLQVVDLVAQLDCAQAAERALVERATWEVQRVINHWSSVPADVLAERQAELADLEACRDRIAALAAVRPEAETGGETHPLEQGRTLASERENLIAGGVDPNDLLIPLAPADSNTPGCDCSELATACDACIVRFHSWLAGSGTDAPAIRFAARPDTADGGGGE